MIKGMTHADIIEEPFKWGEHVWFEIPLEGGEAALEYHQEHDSEGYGFLAYMQDDDAFLNVEAIPAHKDGITVTGIGEMVHMYDEERRIWFHAVYTHSVRLGWHPAFYQEPLITQKIDEWWTEHEEEVVWPMRSVMFGFGQRHQRVGEHRGTGKPLLAQQANTEAQFHLYWTD